MKASKMTNEMLADNLYATMPLLMKGARLFKDADEIMCEAAERLRLKQQSDNYAAALCRKESEYKSEIYDLRRRLKVAEDALRNLQERLVAGVYDGTIDPHEALKIAEDAIAAIREEGATK